MYLLLTIISLLLTAAVFISRVQNDYWIFKVMEYPRLQKLVLVLLTLAAWVYFWPEDPAYFIPFGLLVFSMFYLIYKIAPYTRLIPKEMKRVRSTNTGNDLKIFSANVFQDNREYGRMLQQIRE